MQHEHRGIGTPDAGDRVRRVFRHRALPCLPSVQLRGPELLGEFGAITGMGRLPLNRWRAPTPAEKQGDQEYHQEDEKQDPGNLGGGASNAPEAQDAGDERYDQEDGGPAKHGSFSRRFCQHSAHRCGRTLIAINIRHRPYRATPLLIFGTAP